MGDFAVTVSSWWHIWILEGLLFKFLAPVLALSTIVLTFLQIQKTNKLQDMEYRHKDEIDKLADEIEQYKYANLRESGKVNPESIGQLICGARKSVQLLGINSLGTLHHSQEDLIKFLKDNDGLFHILLLDPHSMAFENRIAFEDDQVERIITEWRSSLRILLSILRKAEGHGAIELRLYSKKPDRSLAIIDGSEEPAETSKMLINYYPRERGKRGYVGGQFLADYSLTRDFDSYDRNTRVYSDLWAGAKAVALDDAAKI